MNNSPLGRTITTIYFIAIAGYVCYNVGKHLGQKEGEVNEKYRRWLLNNK